MPGSSMISSAIQETQPNIRTGALNHARPRPNKGINLTARSVRVDTTSARAAGYAQTR